MLVARFLVKGMTLCCLLITSRLLKMFFYNPENILILWKNSMDPLSYALFPSYLVEKKSFVLVVNNIKMVKSVCKPSGPSTESLSQFPWQEMTRGITILPERNVSPLVGYPLFTPSILSDLTNRLSGPFYTS